MEKSITKFGLLFFLLFQVSCANEKNQCNNNLPCIPDAIKEKFNLNVCFGDTKKEIKSKVPKFQYEKSTKEYFSDFSTDELYYTFVYVFDQNKLVKVSFGTGTSYAYKTMNSIQKGIEEIVVILNDLKTGDKIDPTVPGEYNFINDGIIYDVHIMKREEPILSHNITVSMKIKNNKISTDKSDCKE